MLVHGLLRMVQGSAWPEWGDRQGTVAANQRRDSMPASTSGKLSVRAAQAFRLIAVDIDSVTRQLEGIHCLSQATFGFTFFVLLKLVSFGSIFEIFVRTVTS